MIFAAGILFLTDDGQALFLKRGAGGDRPGEWCFPGGRIEGAETAQDAAKRETLEEVGRLPKGQQIEFMRRIKADPVVAIEAAPDATSMPAPGTQGMPLPGESVDFTTFIQRVKAPFDVTTDGEHTGWAWAAVSTPPEPLHPGCRAALQRLSANELDVARMMAAGDLVSPQQYENFWLFAIRITGTGTAYRNKLDEHVYRPPEIYLTDEFLQRCNGLPTIWQHPKKNMLDSKEYEERICGAIFLPYIQGDEVWGIAKIHDADAAQYMRKNPTSTSPAVFFRNLAVNETITLGDGKKLLIEGNPSLLDHLAICPLGVWDKGGPPAGVRSELLTTAIGDSVAMADEDPKAAEAARKDAEERKADRDRVDALEKRFDAFATEAKADGVRADEKLDKLLSGVDSMCLKSDALSTRMDAMEKGKEDEEETEEEKTAKADKAKKDAEEAAEKEKEKKKADAARADASDPTKIAAAVLAQVESRLPRPPSDADYAALIDAQSRCDKVACVFGDSAPRAMPGETVGAYRRRLAGIYQPHSARWKAVPLAAMDDATFDVVELGIYADALEVGSSPASVGAFQLREIRERDDTGRQITRFVGDPAGWLRSFGGNTRRVVRFNTERRA